MTEVAAILGAHVGAPIHRACACNGSTDEKCSCPILRSAVGPAPTGLDVSSPGDASERHADAVADTVVGMSAPPPIAQMATPASASMPTIASSGTSLPDATRTWFEQRMGHDLSSVRVHTGESAARSATALSARAYTVGRDVVFGAGQYAPDTPTGRRLLAHELAHVVHGQSSTIHRSACTHDTNKGSGCGRLVGTLGEELMEVGADRVVAAGMRKHFGGNWIGQVYGPPNVGKGGSKFGLVDAMKVTTGTTLTLGIAEIKSRNSGMGTGGCSLAMGEAQDYVSGYTPLAPRMAAISKGLAAIGGLSLPDCRKFNKATEAQLKSAGVDTTNTDDMFAWCTLNSIQNKLGTTFVTGFDSVVFQTAKDGAAGTDYTALLMPITCGKKATAGYYRMIFQVNQKGGVSYRCEKQCQPKEEQRKELDKELTKELEIDTGTGRRKFELKDAPIGDENPSEDVDVITEPDAPGVDLTDVAIFTAAALATAKGLHELAKRKGATKAEIELAKKTIEKLAKELERRGATEVAKQLDSKNLSKIGTELYDKPLKEAEEKAAKRLAEAGEKRIAKKLATKMGEKAAKKGAKELLEKGAKAIPYLGAALVILDLGSIADAYAKGADIEFGFSASEADLAGDTKVDIKGDKNDKQPVSDVKATDTKIDIELSKPPDMSGLVELETKNVTMTGKLPANDGATLTVNLSLKLQNTTIIYKNVGRMKGGNVVLDGAFDIKDSTIEIDMPEGTEIEAQSQEGVKLEVKGVKVKVTKPGSGGGIGSGGDKDATSGDKPTEPAEDKAPQDPDAAERTKLLGEIQANPQLKKLYDEIFTKRGTPDLDVLRRLALLKARLDAKPELLEKLLPQLEKLEGADPIKDLIEPMEQALAALERGEEVKSADKPPEVTDAGPTTAPKDDKAKDTTTTGATNQQPTAAAKAAATAITFWSHAEREFKTWERKGDDEEVPKYASPGKLPVVLVRQIKKGVSRTYRFWIYGTFQREIDPVKDSKFEWQGEYNFAPPSGIIKSTNDDHPIYFDDAGTTKMIVYGKHKKAKPKKKKKK